MMGDAAESASARSREISKETDQAKAAFELGLSPIEYERFILKKPAPGLPDKQPLNPPKRPPGTVVPHPKPIEI
jgi:hypothetical protein